MTKKIELLSPAGSLATLKAAIASGANAVYLGMNKFNARENASNFNEAYLKEAIKLCKSNNVKIYFTANTLIKNSEIDEFLEQIRYAYLQGIDAVILQDPGFIQIIRESFPGLKIHMSTQAGIMNSAHANIFSDVESINLARELSKSNIEAIRKNYKNELEIFVHGALCACISGSCLFSSLLGGRSGNRGKCAQPCRKMYNGSFLFSSKELCLIEKTPEIIKLGVDTIKIEGRMRTPYYVATTTSNYRKAIDSFYAGKFAISQQTKDELKSAFCREFTEGKFSDQDCFNTKSSSGTSQIKEKIYEVKLRPFTLEKRKAQIKKPEIKEIPSSGKKLIVRVYNSKDALIADKYADIIVLDLFHKDFSLLQKELSKPLYAATQRIMFDSDLDIIKEKIKEVNPNGILAGNIGVLNFNLNLPIILDYNSNCFNDYQLAFYQGLKATPIVSVELSLKDIETFKNKDFIIFAHGKIRLMTLAHKIPAQVIRDWMGFNFYIESIPNGTQVINEKELGLFNKLRQLVKSGVNQIYIDTESTKEVALEDILKIYSEILKGKTPDASKLEKNYVLGWSKQGVL